VPKVPKVKKIAKSPEMGTINRVLHSFAKATAQMRRPSSQ